MFTEAYEIMITQPVDHNNPDGPKFKEQFFIIAQRQRKTDGY